MRDVISTPHAPKPIGPYSQAIRANGLVFVSRQVAIDSATQQVIYSDVPAQAERGLKNLSAILNAASSGLRDVVRCTVFPKSMVDFAGMNEVYGKYFEPPYPADGRSQAPSQGRAGRN